MADEKILTVPLSKMAAELSEKHEMSKKLAGELLADFVDISCFSESSAAILDRGTVSIFSSAMFHLRLPNRR